MNLRLLTLFFIGCANSLTIPISGTTLYIWLTEAGFDKTYFCLFPLVAIPFNLKIFWTPILDHFSWISSTLQRKSWLLFSIYGMACMLICMSTIRPSEQPFTLALCLFFLSLFQGCLYIAGIAYELESIDEHQYSLGSAFVITGYRIGLLCGGAGALYFSYFLGWSTAFIILAGLLGLGSLLIAYQPEPFKSQMILQEKRKRFINYASMLQVFWYESILLPCQAFFKKPESFLILTLILIFNCGDQISKIFEGPFFISLGFSKIEIATASKVWGMIATLSGTILFGYYLRGKDPISWLVCASCIHACTLLSYYALSFAGHSLLWLYLTVALDHFTGIATASFVYFLWKTCEKQHAATQYTLLWSLYTLKSSFLAFIGGFLAPYLSWSVFYLCVAFCGILTSVLGFIPLVDSRQKSVDSR